MTLGWWRTMFASLFALHARPHLRIWSIPRTLYQTFTRAERRLFLVFFVIALIAITGIIQVHAFSKQMTVPVDGGMYREGVLSTTTHDLDLLTTSLTKVGLIRLAADGSPQPLVANRWTVNDDNQTFTLILRQDITSQEVVDILSQQKETGYWKNAEISKPDSQTVVFHVAKPWAGYLTELATPIFPFGPYQLHNTHSASDGVVSFSVNPRAIIKPHLAQIEVHLFSDPRALDRALRKGSLDSAYLGDSGDVQVPPSWQTWQLPLAANEALFFNVRQSQLASVDVRQKLIKNQSFDTPLELHLAAPDLPQFTNLTDDLTARWAKLNVKLTVERYPILTLTKTIIPDRNYDLLLLAIDDGPESDPYPYWHSSQIAAPGQNFAGYRNKDVDRLLDESRQLKNLADRQARYQQVRKILNDDAVLLDFDPAQVTFIRSPKVKGDLPTQLTSPSDRWTDIADWYMKEKQVPKSA